MKKILYLEQQLQPLLGDCESVNIPALYKGKDIRPCLGAYMSRNWTGDKIASRSISDNGEFFYEVYKYNPENDKYLETRKKIKEALKGKKYLFPLSHSSYLSIYSRQNNKSFTLQKKQGDNGLYLCIK